MFRRRSTADVCASVAFALGVALCAPCGVAQAEPADSGPVRQAGWRFAIDNDLFSAATDRDYTGGVSVTFTGRQAVDWPVSLDPVLHQLDTLVPHEAWREGVLPEPSLRTMQLGLIAFTPENLTAAEPLPDDRPYASLLFVSNSRTYVQKEGGPVYDMSVAFGILGLDAAKGLQRAVHEVTNSEDQANGWDNQISDGGEPTFRVTLARQALLAASPRDVDTSADLKWRVEGSVGYLTEASVALSARWGILNTPWWSMSPERADYMAQPAPILGEQSSAGRRELYLWAGAKARVRGYNAFLQGQFRDSVVELSPSQVEPIIGEAWLGVTWQITESYWLSHVAHYQSREIKDGPGSRDLLWAGLILTHNF